MTDQTRPQTDRPVAESGFFGWVRGLGIVRGDGWFAGVCAGLAERVGIRPMIVRIIAVIAALFAGSAIIVYLVLWMVLPDRDGRIHLETLLNGRGDS